MVSRADVVQALQRTEALELSVHPIKGSGSLPSAMTVNLQLWRLTYATYLLSQENLDVSRTLCVFTIPSPELLGHRQLYLLLDVPDA